MLGRNGVGKTTTVKTIMGLVAAERRARAARMARDITGWPPHRVARAGVAYVPEGRLIFPDLTVVENIRVARARGRRRPGRSPRLIELFPSLRERAAQQGLAALGRRAADAGDRARAGERSEGDAARRAEPGPGAAGGARTGRGDPASARAQGVTILLIEQNMRLAEAVADEMHIMVKGRMVLCRVAASGSAPRKRSMRARYLTV